ncbi:hypothetical protein [Streptomyces sp. NPDC051218]|uniref:hypothetical protein n=1 Tax=Streptomyces sp. NPDC051218 TaxID=3365645 RepID=UPI0037968A08
MHPMQRIGEYGLRISFGPHSHASNLSLRDLGLIVDAPEPRSFVPLRSGATCRLRDRLVSAQLKSMLAVLLVARLKGVDHIAGAIGLLAELSVVVVSVCGGGARHSEDGGGSRCDGSESSTEAHWGSFFVGDPLITIVDCGELQAPGVWRNHPPE